MSMLATPSRRLVHLDALRGLAALLVLVGHLRFFLFPAWDAVPHTPILAFVYAVTGLAHPAVILFFVLSGYLVGGPAIGRAWSGTWNGRRYGVHRVVRLLVVLVPALVLTWAWDAIGQAVNADAYRGAYAARIVNGPTSTLPAVHGISVALGNLVGLQTVLVPVFGSNGPLWSLANESWYYVLGGAAAWLIAAGRRPRTGSSWVAALALVVITTLLLPGAMWRGAAMWFAGAAGERLLASWRPRLRVRWLVLGVALLAAAASSVVFARHADWSDVAVGAAAALAVPCLAAAPSLGCGYRRVATSLSDISYTLYLTHFPAAFALYALVFRGRQAVTVTMGVAFVVGSLVLLAYAAALWWLVERHTPAIRRWAETRLVQTTRGSRAVA
jgi:peptidoglycan/LPS O-acetylase OafA/YrhL